MITFIARLRVLPGKEESALSRARTMVNAVRQTEPGVLLYIGHLSQDDPHEMVFFEVYENEEASELHEGTPHFKELVKDIGPVFDADFGVKIEMLDRIGAVIRNDE